MSTNREQPFEPGELITYAQDTYVVVENHGDKGLVREYPNGTELIQFYWNAYGEECQRLP